MKLLMRLPPCGMALLLALLTSVPLTAQTVGGTVQGFVTDSANNRALQGVLVSVGGKSAVTRADGKYSVVGVPAGTDTLRIRTIGYTPVTRMVTVADGEIVTVDIALAAQAIDLSEMVVIGYGEQRAADITGAVSNVTAEEFNTGRIVTPTELIQNKVAGVQVIESNEPGGGTSIRIRGPSSTTASSDPLYVVDGVPLGTGSGTGISGGRDPLNFLNSSDIESITVLRDASAAAIYGTNAANGVVLITTKRGKAGAPTRVEYSGSVSASSVTRLPDMLNAAQFRAAVEEYAPGSVGQLRDANTDWFGEVDRTGYGQEHNLAISGAGTNSDFRFSASYLDQSGIIKGTDTKRLTLGVNYNQRMLEDRLRMKFSVRGSRAQDTFTPGGVISNAAQMGPTQPVYDTLTVSGFYDWPGGLQSPDNPVALLALAEDKSVTYRSIGNLNAAYDLKFINGLSANLNLGYDITKADRETFNPSTLHRQAVTDLGTQTRNNPTQLNSVLEGYLSYAAPRPVGPGLLDLTGGYSYSTSHAEYPFFTATGLGTDALGNGGVASGTYKQTLDVQDSKLISFFGRVNYNIDSRYLAALSVRHDGSSRFGANNQWGTFPSVALAWRISEEPFLKGRGGLSDLKLRASWAKTGNQSFGNYQQYSTYLPSDATSRYQFGDSLFSTLRPSAVDPDIKWEATRSYDLGIDFGFGNQRFTGSIDWYDKRTDDLIFRVPVAAGSNLSNYVTTNIGSMRNRGIEFSLSAEVLRGNGSPNGGLRWTTDFTAAHNKNELLEINPDAGAGARIPTGGVAGGVGTTIQVLMPGQPINSFYVYTSYRDEDGKPIADTDRNGDGNINDLDRYLDINGDNQINSADLRPFHDAAPKWILGHSSYFNYGKFDLGFTLRAYFGGYVYNNVASNLGTYSEVTRGSPFNLHKSVLETGFTSPQYLSDYYVENADFLRMDNLTLGYSFNLRGQQARVFGIVQNVFTISDYTGVDPTAGINGIDNNIYPRSRTFTGGLSLRF